jgi:hypothetical protein
VCQQPAFCGEAEVEHGICCGGRRGSTWTARRSELRPVLRVEIHEPGYVRRFFSSLRETFRANFGFIEIRSGVLGCRVRRRAEFCCLRWGAPGFASLRQSCPWAKASEARGSHRGQQNAPAPVQPCVGPVRFVPCVFFLSSCLFLSVFLFVSRVFVSCGLGWGGISGPHGPFRVMHLGDACHDAALLPETHDKFFPSGPEIPPHP